MKALVTGGTGFVGRHLIDALLRRGDEVTALVRSPTKARTLESMAVRLVRGDLDDSAALERSTAAQVSAARAQVQTARINLSYATITAPIAGRHGAVETVADRFEAYLHASAASSSPARGPGVCEYAAAIVNCTATRSSVGQATSARI